MATPVRDSKYALQDLHQEIDFFDRKISYCQNYEKFDTEDARAASLQKLVKKREGLVKAALGMASRGIVCDAKYLPRSFKPKDGNSEVTSGSVRSREEGVA